MSLMNNLRQQRLSKQAQELAQARKHASLEQFYRQVTQPALLHIYRSMREFVDHLNYLEHELWVQYPLSPEGHSVPMRQCDYAISIDSLDNTRTITFSAMCKGKLDLKYQLKDPKQVLKHQEYMKHYDIKYQCRAYQNHMYQVTGADMTIKSELPVRLQFSADIANKCVKLSMLNLPGLGSRVQGLLPQFVDNRFIDDLGHFVLRQKEDFLRLNISDEEKQHIRYLVEQEQRLRDWELRQQ